MQRTLVFSLKTRKKAARISGFSGQGGQRKPACRCIMQRRVDGLPQQGRIASL
jgi:hypothetical protein